MVGRCLKALVGAEARTLQWVQYPTFAQAGGGWWKVNQSEPRRAKSWAIGQDRDKDSPRVV